MTRLALCLLLLATGASAEQLTPSIDVLHDDKRSVTCWKYAAGNAGGLSCIPDWMLRGPDQAGNERQLSPHETQPEPTPAASPAAWIDERYQL
ncbi:MULTISPECIES: hypothetical protein [Pseudomonas]|jgi:hypothetical protein|uniref:Uncharacterized protein n=1 Tax=Pseudomonas putida (strain ATCC 47054 / DSM 6125 / CFBP 8728 / NCIMB 11950 / KT2440) TaxID=160488 RepID=A0A140FWJ8_PSEPK|nr:MULTISPECIES: hypothetical protein [Pseudomonas]AMM02981.1 protein of unknown function [Pseudomonas putida KT2440]KMU94674.1 hypothetical protein AC138_17790 [Pseudomonas putida]KMY31152.1 hypothetical protein AA993_20000 [Pseudomonas putida]MDD2081996.1 hypothetical protein [Pseudomonas putida]PXZ46777.1 hypothetical protein DM483_22760 [Pseudomonas sp. SMT-1]